MPPWIRYIIVFLGLVTFLVGAPLLVWFVQGQNPLTKSDEPTGILAVRTTPKGAKVFLDGKDSGTTPSALRFLPPGDYELKISKEHYFDWSKTLSVRANRVTWPRNQDLPVVLVRQPDPKALGFLASTSSSNITWLGQDNLLVFQEDQLVLLNTESLAEVKRFAAPLEQKLLSLSMLNDDIALLRTKTSVSLYQISAAKLLATLPETSQVITAFTNQVVFVNLGVLYSQDTESHVRTTLKAHVAACEFFELVYCLDQEGWLTVSSLNPWQPQTLGQLPRPETNARIFVAQNKQLLLLSGTNLWQLSTPSPELVASGVLKLLDASSGSSRLLYQTSGEIWLWKNGEIVLVTRSQGNVQTAWLVGNAQWVALVNPNEITLLELPETNSQIRYLLSEGEYLAHSPNGKYLLLTKSSTPYFLGPLTD